MNELQEALDRIFNNCEEIDNHIPIEERKCYKMLEDIKVLENGINDLQQRIDKALNMIYENYGLLDKYQIEILEDILKESDKE